MCHLAMHFRIHVSCVHKTIHDMVPILHAIFVPKYIVWPNLMEWANMAGKYPEWPRVVALMDCTPFRINKPLGESFTSLFILPE